MAQPTAAAGLEQHDKVYEVKICTYLLACQHHPCSEDCALDSNMSSHTGTLTLVWNACILQDFFNLVGKKGNQTYDEFLSEFPNLKNSDPEDLALPVSWQTVCDRSLNLYLRHQVQLPSPRRGIEVLLFCNYNYSQESKAQDAKPSILQQLLTGPGVDPLRKEYEDAGDVRTSTKQALTLLACMAAVHMIESVGLHE